MKWLKLLFSVVFLSDLTAVPLLNVSYLAANGGNPTTQRHIICKHTQGSNLDLFGHYGKSIGHHTIFCMSICIMYILTM